MTAIGLISDVHATVPPVEEALSIFRREGVERIFCAGDTAGYRDALDETIAMLIEHDVESVLGNHDLQYLDHLDEDIPDPAGAYFRQLPMSLDTVIDGRRIYMVHAHPPDACHGGIKLRDRSGEVKSDRVAHWESELADFAPDVLVVGHTHQVYAEYIGDTLVINPGSSAFNNSCAILRLPEMTVDAYPLSGHEIAMTWNWSDHFANNR